MVCSRAPAAPGWKQAQSTVSWLSKTTIGDADSVLARHVERLLQTGSTQTICLVTNDKHFAPIARRITHNGGIVWGLGSPNAAASFQKACQHFCAFAPVATTQLELALTAVRASSIS
ncbi:hypothetical protein KSF_103450 [Reticulibacter mediterranei]|uniref:NYN domain-containing protein n=2 Tax=Reticulibacter mediterranei TaxID=2778369 RepID=A0A8J3N6E6_9CHLR|nr:hypothetical protein KSF_103450 [Reticulibacter mediterranei]